MYCLQIFLIFLLFVITFSIHVSSLHSKPYREIKLHLNKSNHIINWNIFWPSTWIRNENNWKLHSFLAYRNRKWKEQANQSRFKKIKLIHTNNIQANLDTKRNQFGHDNLKKSTLSIHLYQERKLSKFDQGSQQNQNTVKIQISDWDNLTDNGTEFPSYYLNPCHSDITRKCEYKYIRNKYDDTKFIRCDKSGNAIIKSCPPSFKWDDKNNQCSLKTTMMVTSTEESTIFSSKNTVQDLTKTDTISSTEIKVETTGISYITSNINTRGTNPTCLIPDWDNQTDNGTELPPYYPNPCMSQPTNNCKFNYKPFYIDDTKFIQCDKYGNARVKLCPTSFRWDNTGNRCLLEIITTMKIPCLIPSGVNQTEKASYLPHIYPNPCTKDPSRSCEFSFKPFLLDPHKFIKCDKFGKASLKSCQVSFRWFQTVQQCLPQIVTTFTPQCQIPAWVNQNEHGTPLPSFYPNPCTADPNRICLFIYKRFLLDQHKFILCDKDGHSLIKSCPPNFKWVVHDQKCSIENIQSTINPQCEVPAWVNEKEKGEPLESFYPNPCLADLSRNCEFIYLLYILDKHKFIQCDRFGNAVKKSCPPHNIWNNHIKQCSIQNIMTTIRPTCSVPNWMNPNEMGLTLPSYLPNPCNSTSIQTCKYFTYVKDDHKFIECDQYGKAWIKSCPPISRWDTTFKKCTAIING